MHEIQLKIYKFLEDTKNKPYKIPEQLLTKFGNETQAALKKHFEQEPRIFKPSMSNVGRPLCQLQMELKHGSSSSGQDINKFLFGDIVEDILFFLIYASGLEVVSEQEEVSLQIGKHKLNGTLDIILNINGEHKVYDVKSASDYSFKTKMNNTYTHFIENDTYGYNEQLFAYSEAKKLKAGGFIINNKSTGDIGVLEVPNNQDELRLQALKKIEYNLDNLNSPFKRSFSDVSELFKKKPTGNKCLTLACDFCNYKQECWPDLKLKPQAKSTAKTKKMVWYTEYNEHD